MSKIEEAKDILQQLNFEPLQTNKISALTLLALANLKEEDSWQISSNPRLGVKKGIMNFMATHYNENYAENTRESVRRKVLHYFIQANIVEQNPDDKSITTNSSRNNYALTPEFLSVLKNYKTIDWNPSLAEFLSNHKIFREKYETSKAFEFVPVVLPDGKTIELSAGLHNQLEKSIVEQFAPRFAPNSILLYLGDTAKKDIIIDKDKLQELGIAITKHSKLPDVILYREENNWIYFIEAVTSHGPVSQKRINELEELFENCSAGKIYVTAFPNITYFKKYSNDIAWETEVWLMDMPDHMIHFNGDRFMGPR